MTTLIAVSAIRRFCIDAAAVLRSVAAVVGLAVATAACSSTDAITKLVSRLAREAGTY